MEKGLIDAEKKPKKTGRFLMFATCFPSFPKPQTDDSSNHCPRSPLFFKHNVMALLMINMYSSSAEYCHCNVFLKFQRDYSQWNDNLLLYFYYSVTLNTFSL